MSHGQVSRSIIQYKNIRITRPISFFSNSKDRNEYSRNIYPHLENAMDDNGVMHKWRS